MKYTLNSIFFFLKKNVFFFKKNIFLYLYSLELRNWQIILIQQNTLVTEISNISYKLENYIDDLDRFDSQNRKYKLYRNIDKKVRKNKALKLTTLSRSIYEDNGLLKRSSTWYHYLKGRYGIGNGLYKLFTKYNGTLVFELASLEKFSTFLYKTSLEWFFLFNIDHFDYKKAISSFHTFYRHKYRFTFKGWCYLHHYPVNGQKRKTNYKTTRTYNRLIILKIKK